MPDEAPIEEFDEPILLKDEPQVPLAVVWDNNVLCTSLRLNFLSAYIKILLSQTFLYAPMADLAVLLDQIDLDDSYQPLEIIEGGEAVRPEDLE